MEPVKKPGGWWCGTGLPEPAALAVKSAALVAERAFDALKALVKRENRHSASLCFWDKSVTFSCRCNIIKV
ncbi:hypothetical protein [Desulfallas thermosapovorans]|uniref:hypothetical protein n=1 Tax=Desulfallas thermosapovorans TaxID=58137 RepID=UPI001412F4D8|nr:hypothetical protein [Desulfallas thermosapovorans]